MSAIAQHSEPLSAAQLLARIKSVGGQGSGLDADTVRGLGPDSSPFAVGGMIGIVGFGKTVPRSPFQGCVYPSALLGV